MKVSEYERMVIRCVRLELLAGTNAFAIAMRLQSLAIGAALIRAKAYDPMGSYDDMLRVLRWARFQWICQGWAQAIEFFCGVDKGE